MNPVNTISPHIQSVFPSLIGSHFLSNDYSGFTSSAEEELSSHSSPQSPQEPLHYPGQTATSATETETNELLNQDNLNRFKDLIAACRANPNILYTPEMTFFKEYLESLKAKIPNKSEQQKTEYTLAPVKPTMGGEDYLVENEILPFKCIQCGKGCKTNWTLKRHMISHTGGDGTYKCSQCDRIFGHKSSLKRHMITHTGGEETHKCNQCDKTFAHKRSLDYHIKAHNVENEILPFICIHCGKGCKTNRLLKRHMITHTGGDGTHKCNQCDRTFAYESSLEYHIKTHSGVKPYSCSECDKAFFQMSRLEMHMRIHTGERPYQCNQCGKTFRQYNAHTRHMSTHSEEKPFQCSQCEKFFSCIENLKKHAVRHNIFREKKYKCIECDKAFFRNDSLKKHMKMHPEVKWATPEND